MVGGVSKRAVGESGERYAVEYLSRQGFAILECNYVYNHGEVDIVAQEGNELVFVEVKTRRGRRFGPPEEAVVHEKQELVRRTAEGYVREHAIVDVSCRFDVIAISIEGKEKRLVHYRNAF